MDVITTVLVDGYQQVAANGLKGYVDQVEYEDEVFSDADEDEIPIFSDPWNEYPWYICYNREGKESSMDDMLKCWYSLANEISDEDDNVENRNRQQPG